jgi:hypothetical protein
VSPKDTDSQETADYAAALSPDVVLSLLCLLDRLDALEATTRHVEYLTGTRRGRARRSPGRA